MSLTKPMIVWTLTAIGVVLFVRLGVWQLHRAEIKRELQSQYEARSTAGIISLGGEIQTPERLRFYRVVAEGTYDTRFQVLIDNRVHEGRVGYYVVTPLHLSGSDTRVLVNRGWIPLGESRDRLPLIPTPGGTVSVTGVATVPLTEYFQLQTPKPLDKNWQTVWQHMDMARYQQAVDFPVQPVVVLLDPENAAGGFVRRWSGLDAGIAVHQSYAFQWFTLAIALILLIWFSQRRGKDPSELEG